MIHGVGEEYAVRQLGAESGKSGVVGDIAGGKDESGVFAVKRC